MGALPSQGLQPAIQRLARRILLAQDHVGANQALPALGIVGLPAQPRVEPGDHVLAGRAMYFGTPMLLRDWGRGWGLEIDFVDMTDLAAVEAAGYTGIHDLDLDDAVWDLEALSPEGQQVDLRVHGFSGEILVVEIDD